MKISTVTVVLICMVLLPDFTHAVFFSSPQTPAQQPAAAADEFCDGKCSVRCKLKGRNSRCFKYCMMCCGKCRCVPSDTFGNLNECRCYRDWKSPNGRPKCP
ncbi:peamaclein-like [Amaranthus tricolor]|uniref:peamaclein-like n=1 Tax=Amaranthus tricolor TaxID=29722 RepID=UPI00258D45F6|nr:peamaclein-like [Amaranthus tricolor]